jgi:predicted DNA-binding transcriptional regulator YafY
MGAHPLSRHTGDVALIIYLDRAGRISQRRVRIDSVIDGKIRAYCYLRGGIRLFHSDRVLAFRILGRGRRSV